MKDPVIILLAFLLCLPAQADEVSDLLQQGDSAARVDRHQTAIDLYERALRLKPDIREALLPKLAAQYLWNEEAEKASALLNEYLQKHPEDCESRTTLALALSWTDHLSDSRRDYSEVAEKCPALAPEARLGEARVLRWMDHLGQADVIYEDIERIGTLAQKREAEIGRALTQLARDNNRAALEMFNKLNAQSGTEATVIEGRAISEMHLGLPDQALAILRQKNEIVPHNSHLADLNDHLERSDDFALSPSFQAINDSDGTRYRAEELAGLLGWNKRDRAEIHLGASSLGFNHQEINGRWGGIVVEHRFNESLALRATG